MPTAVILLVILGTVWSLRLSAVKYAFEAGLAPHLTIQVSILGIAAGLTLLNLIRRTRPPLHGAAVRFYLASGLLGFICPFSLEAIVAPRLPLFVLVLIVTTVPIWTLLIAAGTRVERLTGIRLAGVLLGFAAAGLVALDSMSVGGGGIDPLWCLLALAIPLLYAVYTVFVASRWPTGVDAVQVAQGQAIAVSIAILAALPFQPSWAALPLERGPVTAVAGVVICEIIGLMLYLRLARDRGPTFVAMANYIAICVGAAVSFAFFGDEVGWPTVLGAVLLVVALQLARVRPVAGATASSG